MAVLILALALPNADAATTTYATGASGYGNCFPFGCPATATGWNETAGFIYRDIAPFTLAPGDRIEFDLNEVNNVPIELELALAATTVNGGDQPAGSFVIAAAQQVLGSGNTVTGDYDIRFTATTPYTFPGGGLVMRFRAFGAFKNDSTYFASGGGMLRFPSATGVAVKRFFQDADGEYPWTTSTLVDIAAFRIVTSNNWYADTDGDGHGDPLVSKASSGAGWVASSDDCDDTDPGDFAGADETPANGDDEDCNGKERCWQDLDADGYGTALVDESSTDVDLLCEAVNLEALVPGDCDGLSPEDNPGAIETPGNADDDDCNGAEACFQDLDRDGFGSAVVVVEGPDAGFSCGTPDFESALSGDCDDLIATSLPGGAEIIGNEADDDCDGFALCFIDLDADGYITGSAGNDLDCTDPGEGSSNLGPDCDDSDDDSNPGSVELPGNDRDENCDGSVVCWTDDDSDAWGSTSPTAGNGDGDCSDAGEARTRPSFDCDDALPSVNPAASEICDAIDQDCDGAPDDGLAAMTWFADLDGDEFGATVSGTVTTCAGLQPATWVANGGDCDDDDPLVSPAAVDVAYNGVDEDCTGGDEDDVDGDGFVGVAAGGPDCDDTNDDANPDQDELPNGFDDDCDGFVDEGTDAVDDDGDGFAEAAGDCDDANSKVSPTAVEVCDGRDEDCDHAPDDGTECFDDDDDGFTEIEGDCDDASPERNPDAVEIPDNDIDDDCDGKGGGDDPDGDGISATAGDCDPEDADTWPGAPELEDGVDNDCDGLIDDGTSVYDDDDDGTTEAEGDCDDSDALVNETATELPDGRDQDCDGVVDEGTWLFDDDGDGFTESGGDCNDEDDATHPGAEDVCDAFDGDCDGREDPACYQTVVGGGCACESGGTGATPVLLSLAAWLFRRRRTAAR